jgi:hypothetical protein
MKRKSFHSVLLVALLLVCNLSYGQDSLGPQPKRARTPEDYKPRTLKEVSAVGAGAEGVVAGGLGDKRETMVVHGDIFPSRVRAKYTGSKRAFPRHKKEVLRQWARLYAGVPEGYTAPYETEMLFREDGAEYWLAVRKEALPRFGRELKRGGAVDLYLIRVGAAKSSDAWEPVLLVESFRKPN